MKKTYFLSYAASLGTYDEVMGYINSSELIITWRKELPSMLFIVSEASAVELRIDIEAHFGEGKGGFLVAEIGTNCEGRLDSRSWSIINQQKLPPKKAESKE